MNNGKKTGLIVAIVIIAIVIGVVGSAIGSYNSLVNADENVKKAYSDIHTDLQRRNDLIPNLVETVKQYASHEEEVFTAISDARSKLIGAGNNVEDLAEANAQMSSALSRLLAISEAYPELKANQNFLDLQTQLEGTENRIAVARTKYNDSAKVLNSKIRKFPSSIFAGMFGFEKADYFEAEAGAENVPDVSDMFEE